MSRTQVHAGSSGYPDIVETWVRPRGSAARSTPDKLVDIDEPEYSVQSSDLVDCGQIPNIMDM
ncbi:hypothetical protein ACRALDRAFT_1080656 [Sodiomyces alcalophilus JCM 7366]|uniref:uncharacterized protein n=1 Tax=Sodiomyces alcalophilus JCM 7366 TaxID=591952 RepID=UPI0039B3A64D